jgi:ribosomal protein L29
MVLLRNSDIQKMKKEEIETKLNELRMESVRAKVTANKQNAKTKEIKRAIARLLTFNKSKDSLKKQ